MNKKNLLERNLIISFFLLFIIIGFSYPSRAQFNYETPQLAYEYKLTYIPDTVSKIKKYSTFVLILGDSSSLFYDLNLGKQDKIISNTLAGGVSFESASKTLNTSPLPSFKYIIKKNRVTSFVTFYETIGLKGSLHYQELPDIDWQGGLKTGTIMGIPVSNAKGEFAGRIYSAWYSTHIPISDGPYKFSGLPGLIIKISDEREEYVFELIKEIDLTTWEKPSFSFYQGSKQVDKFKFLSIKHDAILNPLLGVEAFSEVYVPEESKKIMHEVALKRLKTNNNPIELSNNK